MDASDPAELVLDQQRIEQWTYHIAYSPSFQVPLLLFRVLDAEGTPIVPNLPPASLTQMVHMYFGVYST
jgi:hypothetical protein